MGFLKITWKNLLPRETYKHSLSCGGMSVYLREMCSVARSTKHCTNPILTLQCAVCFPLSLRLDNYISFLIVRSCVGALVYLSSRGIKKKTVTNIKPLLDVLDVRRTSATHHHLSCRYKASTGRPSRRSQSVTCVSD